MKYHNRGILLWTMIVEFFMLCDSQRFANTGLYQRLHIDGPGGECKLSPYIKSGIALSNSEVECESGWTKNQTHSTVKMTIPNKRRCKYFKRTVTYFCYDSPQGRDGPVTCIRNTIFYHMLSTCSDYWLNWGKCDKNCGGGMKSRVRITKSSDNIYRINTDYKPCNVHSCPRWTEWEPTNVNGSCDPKTCTRVWKRHCLFNNTVANPSLCSNDELVQHNIFNGSNDNSTYETRSCFLRECIAPVSTTGATSTMGNILTSVVLPDTTGPLFQGSIQNVEITCTADDNIWLGIGIGFSVALCVFLLGCCIAYHSRNRIKSYLGSKHSEVNELACEYATNLETLHVDSPPALITPLGSIEDIAQLPCRESIYCTVPSQPNAVNLGQDDLAQQDSSVDVSFNHLPNVEETDPSVCMGNRIKNVESAAYSTSEFESCSDDDLDVKTHSNELAQGNTNPKEEGCMSFDSDEDRDVVHTLRKPNDQLKNKRLICKEGADNVFYPEGEVLLHYDHNYERDPTSVVRYSKLIAKRSKNEFSHAAAHAATENKGTESEFRFATGTSHTSMTSELSLSASKEIPEDKPLTEEGRGQQKLPCRHSSGGSSIISCNLDAVTSGYNSAHSTDDDHFVWDKKACSRRRRSTLRSTFSYKNRREAQQKWKLSSLRNYASTERQHTNTINLRPRTANSLFNPKISRLPDSEQERTVNSHEKSPNSWSIMYADVSSYSCTLPGRGYHTKDDIEIEDVYSFPVDARPSVFEENVYTHYNVPFDALQS